MADQWYYSKGGQQFGPISQEQLQGLFGNGTLTPDDLVWAEGMSEWVPGRHVPGLLAPGVAQPGMAPVPGMPYGQPLGYAAPAPARPTSVTVIAVIGIIFGSLGVLGSICGVIALPFIRNQMAAQGKTMPTSSAWVFISAFLGIALGGLLLAASISALRLTPWARTGLLVYAGLSIVIHLISSGVNFAQMSGQATTPMQTGIMVGSLIGGMIFPVCILYFMTRPHVVAAFTPGREGL
jgi:GYF domain 2